MRENSSNRTVHRVDRVRRVRTALLSGMTVAAVAVVTTLATAPTGGTAAPSTVSPSDAVPANAAPAADSETSPRSRLQSAPRWSSGTTSRITSGSAVLGPGAQTLLVPKRITAKWSGSISTGHRWAVNRAYWRDFAPYINTSSGWTGTDSPCRSGSNSRANFVATKEAINFVRSLNGLAPIYFSKWQSYRAIRSALMMEANDQLSHYPTRDWRCYTWTGDVTAAKSNLALSYPEVSAGRVVDMYMDDRGSNNKAVGHRRWILYPFTTTMGLGSTSTANALAVVGPTSTSRPNPRWTSWPSRGWFPGTLEPAGRWSLSSGIRSENFSRAVVKVWKNGTRIYPRKYGVVNGYGMPTIVWQMPHERVRRGVYTVRVSRITRPGVDRSYSYTYRVRIFSPYR